MVGGDQLGKDVIVYCMYLSGYLGSVWEMESS